jgi:hypothetical protein
VKVADLTKLELDYWTAIAMGASPDKKPKDNQLVTGLPFLHCPGKTPHFRVVNAAGVSTVWRPSASWIDAGALIKRMAESNYLTVEDRPPHKAACMYREWRAEADDLCTAIARVFVMNAFGLHVNEEPALS